MSGFWEYLDKRNQRSTEFENERFRRLPNTTAADIGLMAFVAIVLRGLAEGLTDGTVEIFLRSLIAVVVLVLALVLAARAWIRYRRDKRAWTAEHPL